MKFHRMKMIDVARMTKSEIAEIESEIVKIQFIDAVLCFVVAVVSFAILIDLRFDVLIASIAEIALI